MDKARVLSVGGQDCLEYYNLNYTHAFVTRSTQSIYRAKMEFFFLVDWKRR